MLGAVLLLANLLAAAPPAESTEAARSWARTHPPIRVAQPLAGPFAVMNGAGRLEGLSLDYLDDIAARTGLRFENMPVANVTAGIAAVREGRADAVMGLGRTPQREEMLLFGGPFAYSPDAIVTRSDSPFLFDLRELGGKRVAIARSSHDLARRFAAQVPDAAVATYEAMDEAVLAVARGEVDVAVVDASIAAFVVKQRSLTQLRVGGVFDAPAEMYIGVRRDWPELVPILDEALESMSAADRTRILNRWMVLDYESDRRWQRAFRALAAVLGLAALGALALAVFNRRMNRELALRRRIQAELEATSGRLARADAEKSELMRMIAHDLRSPLAALRANAQFLAGETSPDDPEARDALASMIGCIDRMRSLINVLGDRHALESGERRWTWAQVDPGEEVRAAVRYAQEAAARRKGIEVVARTPADVPRLEADREALRQVVDNLLSNAVKFSRAGSRVSAEVAALPGAVRIGVSDQGPGVPPEERKAIFEKYRVGSAQPTAGEVSTGLGLWIVDRLVRDMGGRVWCEDAPGGGAAFCVELPLTRAASSAGRGAVERGEGAGVAQ